MRHIPGGVYQHYKGQYYFVLGVARRDEDDKDVVVYIPLYMSVGRRMSTRDYDEFTGTVTINGIVIPRFRFCKKENCCEDQESQTV